MNLIAEQTIEHRMLGTLAAKQGLADGVLDSVGDLKEIKLQKGAQTFLSKLELMIGPTVNLGPPPPGPATAPVDAPEAFARHAAHLLGAQLVGCEERFPEGQTHSVLLVVVERDSSMWRERLRPAYEKLVGNRQSAHPTIYGWRWLIVPRRKQFSVFVRQDSYR